MRQGVLGTGHCTSHTFRKVPGMGYCTPGPDSYGRDKPHITYSAS